MTRIEFYFLPQTRDVNAQHRIITDILVIPNAAQQVIVCDNLPCIPHQCDQQAVLNGGQAQWLPTNKRMTAWNIQLQLANGEFGFRLRCPVDAAEQGFYARYQFIW